MASIDESVREIVMRRDGLAKEEVDDLFLEFALGLEAGEEPEELLREVFGLEPDYFWDNEIQTLIANMGN